MSIGIYKLNFPNTNKCYIGQSTNIYKRYKEHLNSMRKGFAKQKVQEAFNQYGEPSLEVLLDNVSVDDLNNAEAEAIEIFNAIDSGFNTLNYAGNPDIRGADSCHAKLDKDTYRKIFRLLADTDMSTLDIVNKSGATKSIVGHIFIGRTHQWLYEEDPVRASIILEKRTRGRYYTKSDSPRRLVSPVNILYTLTNISKFCREHELNTAHISSVLNGTRKSHKGWTKYIEGIQI